MSPWLAILSMLLVAGGAGVLGYVTGDRVATSRYRRWAEMMEMQYNPPEDERPRRGFTMRAIIFRR